MNGIKRIVLSVMVALIACSAQPPDRDDINIFDKADGSHFPRLDLPPYEGDNSQMVPASSPGSSEYGQTSKATIGFPSGYGQQLDNGGLRCYVSGWDGPCLIPNNKTFSIAVSMAPSSMPDWYLYGGPNEPCSAWWAAQALGVAYEIKAWVEAHGGTVYVMPDIYTINPNPQPANYMLGCNKNVVGGNADGAFSPSWSSWVFDCHDLSGSGELCQFSSGAAFWYAAGLIANPATAWNSKTESQKVVYARNVIRHEIGHALGFGHVNSSGCYLMGLGPANCWFNESFNFTSGDGAKYQVYSP